MTRSLVHPRSGIPWSELKARARAMRTDGAPFRAIAAALDVMQGAVQNWVGDLPCHEAVKRRNNTARYERTRLYPPGYKDLANKLGRLGYDQAARIQLVAETAKHEGGRPRRGGRPS